MKSPFLLYLLPLLTLVASAAEPKFEAQVVSDSVAIGYGVAIGDVDGDGKPDIILADKKVFCWYRNPDWKRFVMAENLTAKDNVCIAARDIDGDGKVEVAVGGQWNPGNTSDPAQSGSVHYLVPGEDRSAAWEAVQLPHDPTIHRMRWAKAADGSFHLIVLPLHGRDNKSGVGENGTRVRAYTPPANRGDAEGWKVTLLHELLHMTHNFDVAPNGKGDEVLVAGFEGVVRCAPNAVAGADAMIISRVHGFRGAGEVRRGPRGKDGVQRITTIEQMHGNEVCVYEPMDGGWKRTVLESGLNQGHALACADFLGTGSEQIVAGWRNPDKEKKVGIRLYAASASGWASHTVDDNRMACEDLKVADLNGDGKPDIVAAGRRTKNLVIYWNRN